VLCIGELRTVVFYVKGVFSESCCHISSGLTYVCFIAGFTCQPAEIWQQDSKKPLAQHILQNIHEYGTITDIMSLLKSVYNTTMLIPYEQRLIHTFHHNDKLIPEQASGEPNPLIQLALDTSPKSRPFQNRPTPPTPPSQTSSNSTMVRWLSTRFGHF
jgi:hypothetical protein